MSGAMNHGDEAGEQLYIAPDKVDDLFHKVGWSDERKAAALDLISAERCWYAEQFASGGDDALHVAWEIRPFMKRPFLRTADGALYLLSPRAIQSWLSDGFHYRLLDAAQALSVGDPARKISRRYTAFAGELLERYVLDLVRSSHGGKRPVGSGRVYGEQPYGGGSMTSDVAVDLGLDLVLMEVCVSRLRADTLLLGRTEDVLADLDRMVIRKIEQLDTCITALVDGRAEIPTGSLEVDMSRVRRVWPVLVTAGSLTQTELLWGYITRNTEGLLAQPMVQPLTIFDLEDVEAVCGFAEHGLIALHDLLAAKSQPAYQQLELAIWLRNAYGAPNERPRPSMVEKAWKRTTSTVLTTVDFTKGIQPDDRAKPTS